MKRVYVLRGVALLLCAVLLVGTGCETMGGSAGAGALIGAGIGGVLSGREGAMIGGALGGLVGAIAYDVKRRRLASREEVREEIGYEESMGLYLEGNGIDISNPAVSHGQETEINGKYRLAGVDTVSQGGPVQVREKLTLERDGEVVAVLVDEDVTQDDDGEFSTDVTLEVSDEIEPGVYRLSQVVSLEDKQATNGQGMTVTEMSAEVHLFPSESAVVMASAR